MSDTQDKILNILKDGQFHSGESLGEALGCSRTAVWKQLQKLENLGHSIESIKGTGYRVSGGFELFDSELILSHLSEVATAQLSNLEIFRSIESTNKYAREKAECEPCSGSVILAEQQSAGRGRRGKTWVSPFAANIYLSIVWDFEQGAQALEGLSLAVGVAVKRALNAHGVDGVQLKWPNDIYIDGQKLGGILLEMIGDPAGHCSVIVGVGINLAMPADHGSNIDQEWTDIRTQMQAKQPEMEENAHLSKNHITSSLISEIIILLSDFQAQGFSSYRDEWQAADAFYGLQAAIHTPKQSIAGIVRGVDPNGALRLELDNGEIETFIGGELSLRLSQ
jgi:BirA family transcriptional regulator, biotin operon repressor / biotin---[acetyl-CoA-carboxylase] ligase